MNLIAYPFLLLNCVCPLSKQDTETRMQITQEGCDGVNSNLGTPECCGSCILTPSPSYAMPIQFVVDATMLAGDPKYGVPNLDPLDIKEIKVRQGTKQVGLNLALQNCKLIGMINAEFTKARVDFKKRHVEWDFVNKQGLQLVGKYNATGQVLLLPISGQGKANITLVNLKNINYNFDFNLIKRKDGKEYMNVTTGKMTFDIGKAYFNLENLFNGDPVLGNTMNRFLNENWKELIDEFAPEIGGAIAEVFKRLLTSILGTVPYNEIFPIS